MNIDIECFGVAARLSGARRHQLSLPAPATVRDALDALAAQFPELVQALPNCACAVGDDIVPRDHRLVDGDALALLPPVSGG